MDEKTANWAEEWEKCLAKLRSHFFAVKPREWEELEEDDKEEWEAFTEGRFADFIEEVYPVDPREACHEYYRAEEEIRTTLRHFCAG